MNYCFIISLCLSSTFSFFISIFSTEAAPEYLFHDCPNTTLFTPSSTYRSNLRILLSSLSSAATGSADGFTNAAAGQNPPDRAYGSSSAVATSTAPCAATAWPLGNRISSKDVRTSKSPQSGMTSACCGTRTGSSSWPWSNRRIGSNLRHELYPFYYASALRSPAPPLPAPAPPPPAPVTGPEGKSIKFTVIIIMFALAVFTTLVFLFLVWCIRRKNATKTHAVVQGDQIGLTEITNSESLRYNLATILVTTNNFSHQNKLGNGGFGEVFLGMLLNGVLIAVKRLSQLSRQGAEEFKNEVMLLPKLQHRNIVQLLGFCLEGAEKVLIYEFVQNKSLDYFLFDPKRSRHLNWSTRYKIACGIARGMCYIHDDSRIRVIHRDLKSSNILLDNEMNPKISDFGMARIFGVNQTLASTERIAGTYGYMSPEYAMNGQFSVKSDVYSFGILLMELVSGKKNGSFYQEDGNGGIAIHAWKNWRGGTPLAVLDPAIGDAYSMDEVLGCLRIGLLCTLEDPNQRPTMASIVCELSSLPITLELPQRPAFFLSRTQRMMEELESDKSTGRSIPTWYRVSSL